MKSLRWPEWLLIAAIALVTFVLQVRTPPVADDWGPMATAVETVRQGHLLSAPFSARDIHWSPFWFLMNAAAYEISPATYGIVPLAVVKSAMAAALAWILLLILRSAGVRRDAALVAAILPAFHQAIVGAHYQWKSVGAAGSCAAGAASAALIVIDIIDGRASWRRGWIAGVLLFLALGFKENAIAWSVFAAMTLAGSFMIPRVFGPVASAWRRTSPSLIATAAFWFLRRSAGGVMQLEETQAAVHRYRFGNPLEWLINASQLTAATLSPVGTLRWFDAIHHRSWPLLVLFAGVTLILGVLLLAGLFRARHELGAAAVIACCGLLSSWFPVVLMHHISETYIGPSVFWFSMLAAIAMQRASRPILYAVAAIALAWHLDGFAQKWREMRVTGHHEIAAMQRALPHLRALAPGSSIFIWDAVQPLADRYSVYREFEASGAIQFGAAHERIPVVFVGDKDRARYWVEAGETVKISERR